MLNAKWSLVDDHEILTIIGPNSHLLLSGILGALSETEISANSTLPRFRPTYFLFRLIESVVWGKDPSLWYGFRMAISVVFGISIAFLSIAIVGPVLGLGFILFSLSQPYWSDIFSKAGPSEIYAILGCALLIILFCNKGERKNYSSNECFLIAFAIIIASGSKENFLFLGTIPLFILIDKSFKKTFIGKIFLISPLIYISWIIYTLALRLREGADVYQNDISIYTKLNQLKLIFLNDYFLLLLSLAIGSTLVFGISALLLRKCTYNCKAELVNQFIICLKWQIVLIVVFLSQYIFYYGAWSSGALRYLFPAVLAVHFSILISIFLLMHAFSIFPYSKNRIKFLKIIGFTLFILLSIENLFQNRNISSHSARISLDFDKKYIYVEEILKRNPSIPLIIFSNHPNDYESIFAINRFLYSRGVPNKVGVKLNDSSYIYVHNEPLHTKWLKGAILKVSQDGTLPKTKDNYFDPIDSLDLNNCVSVSLSGDSVLTCKYGNIRLWN
jgi:hypothetical protein